MIDDRPQADRIRVAQLHGEAKHHARWRELTGEEEAAAVAALRELAGGRADLLAEVAGILEGASEGQLDEPLARQAAVLCRKAGADPETIPAWIAEGPQAHGQRQAAAVLQFAGAQAGPRVSYRRNSSRVTPSAPGCSRRTAAVLPQKTPRLQRYGYRRAGSAL